MKTAPPPVGFNPIALEECIPGTLVENVKGEIGIVLSTYKEKIHPFVWTARVEYPNRTVVVTMSYLQKVEESVC